MKVLLGEISSYKAIVIAEFLKKNYPDIFILTYDYLLAINHLHTRYSDKHYSLKSRSGDDYISELVNLCKLNDIDVFIPVHSDNIASILNAKDKFGKALAYLGNYNDYINLHNKDVLQSLARNIGIDTPQNYLTYEDARVPFVIKPIDKSSAKGVRYFKSDKSKNAFSLTQDKKVIIQEYIQGFGCGYSVFVKEGVIKVGYGHKRLAEFPVSGGSSVYRATFFDPRMKSIADKIFQEVQWSGFAMIEFKYTPDNRLVLIEVNPRIWGSVNQGLQCGINYFEPIFGHGKLNYQQKEINTYLSPQIYASLIQYLMKFNFKPLSKFISSIRKNKGDLSLMNDPKGFLSVIARKVLKTEFN